MSRKILYTGGTFDLFHSGHVNFLSRCKLLADEVVVSLNTDQFIKKRRIDYRKTGLTALPDAERFAVIEPFKTIKLRIEVGFG